MNKKTLGIFGCTGSIGKSALDVYWKNKNKFELSYISAHKNLLRLKKINQIYKPKFYFLTSIKNKFFEKLIQNKKKILDYAISGVSGYNALDFNFNLLKISKNLLIANKETIICGGNVFLSEAKKNDCKIIPIDSEHHCIDFFLKNFSKRNEIKKIFLPASGGPFLNKKIKYNEKIKDVINHPNWKMGKKISVDSSTFSNKIMEMFEAKILFGLNQEKISIIVEEKSNVHALIQLKNNFVIPIIHHSSMEIAISNSLNLYNKFNFKINGLKINFKNPDFKKFPVIKLGYKIMEKYDHAAMIIFTVINERLVNMYLGNQIKYGDISLNLVKAFSKKTIIKMLNKRIYNLKDIKKLIYEVSKLSL